eukprot:CAMPEP_0174954688 /NCGR_PEP_ID=MMETSP0004_2-20121128/565_1 /TAXON_ID=420556 /ORGANISM="Ochromonas sp., Strain CCMP1393" /LENGTH=341 /DNA_ID=CAMNT_0016202533 /DNA_START=135 /DNA_END=1160 /DNA_ORIENTATION=+
MIEDIGLGSEGVIEESSYEPPVLHAATMGDLVAIENEIGIGANMNVQNVHGYTPVMFAVQSNQREALVMLVREGKADVNIRERDGWTALMMAAFTGNVDLVHILLEFGADPLIRSDVGVWAYQVAAARHSEQARVGSDSVDNDAFVLELLLEASLRRSIAIDDPIALLEVVRAGAPVNFRNEAGWTPLILACARGYVSTVVYLVSELGADVNLAENDGWTPLMFAANNDQPAIAQILLENGADAGLASVQGFTAFSLAQNRGFDDVLIVLDRKGAPVPNTPIYRGNTKNNDEDEDQRRIDSNVGKISNSQIDDSHTAVGENERDAPKEEEEKPKKKMFGFW